MIPPLNVLGMPLEAALTLCRAQGLPEPEVITTQAPRNQRSEGTLRVIRVREGQWTVSAFMDDTPKE